MGSDTVPPGKRLYVRPAKREDNIKMRLSGIRVRRLEWELSNLFQEWFSLLWQVLYPSALLQSTTNRYRRLVCSRISPKGLRKPTKSFTLFNVFRGLGLKLSTSERKCQPFHWCSVCFGLQDWSLKYMDRVYYSQKGAKDGLLVFTPKVKLKWKRKESCRSNALWPGSSEPHQRAQQAVVYMSL
jgi:hypothetical protein